MLDHKVVKFKRTIARKKTKIVFTYLTWEGGEIMYNLDLLHYIQYFLHSFNPFHLFSILISVIHSIEFQKDIFHTTA